MKQNHFELFHLPVRYAVDMAALDRAYHDVQGKAHPDRFAQASAAEKRVAMQWATRANEAYQTLRNPFRRAAYLCELNGVDLEMESNTAMPPSFLMQQMEWREALDEARTDRDVEALAKLERALREERNAELEAVQALLDAGNYAQAAQKVRQLMFMEKFGEEVSRIFDVIDSE